MGVMEVGVRRWADVMGVADEDVARVRRQKVGGDGRSGRS